MAGHRPPPAGRGCWQPLGTGHRRRRNRPQNHRQPRGPKVPPRRFLQQYLGLPESTSTCYFYPLALAPYLLRNPPTQHLRKHRTNPPSALHRWSPHDAYVDSWPSGPAPNSHAREQPSRCARAAQERADQGGYKHSKQSFARPLILPRGKQEFYEPDCV